MAAIIPFASHAETSAEEYGAREWLRFFRCIGEFTECTRWPDLPDGAVLFFCEERRDGSAAFFDALMQAIRPAPIDYRGKRGAGNRLAMLMTAYFFILDRARLECMRRLGWTGPLPGEEKPVLEEVMDPASYDWDSFLKTPEPTPEHPAHKDAMRTSGPKFASLVRGPYAEAMRRLRLRAQGEADARPSDSPMDAIRSIETNNLNN
jgi:hypothetical protein